jgi:hypothetical protein
VKANKATGDDRITAEMMKTEPAAWAGTLFNEVLESKIISRNNGKEEL